MTITTKTGTWTSPTTLLFAAATVAILTAAAALAQSTLSDLPDRNTARSNLNLSGNGTLTTATAATALAATTSGDLSGVIIGGGGSSGAVWMTSPSFSTPVLMGADRDTLYGVPAEKRPNDAKGPTLHTVKYTAQNWDAIRLAPSGYLERARRIALQSAGTDEARLLQAVHDTHLRVYDFARVDAYLYREALKRGSSYRWVWEPLREKDKQAAGSFGGPHAALGYVYAGAVYPREVPDRVLADIERLLDCAPADTLLLVSDYRAVNPDPFLAVATPRMLEAGRILIVDQWDEPGFTDQPAQSTIALK